MAQSSQKSDDIRAKIRGLATLVVDGAAMKPPLASTTLSDENLQLPKTLRELEPESTILRLMAQILPRSNEEVVALGVSQLTKPKGGQTPQYKLIARNSVHARPKHSQIVETLPQLSQTQNELRRCNGVRAVKTVVDLLSRCKGKNSKFDPDLISFEDHVNIFTAFLQNKAKMDNKQKSVLEIAFRIYTTHTSYYNHMRRVKEDPVDFFLQEAPKIKSTDIEVLHKDLATHSGSIQDYLNAQASELKTLNSPITSLLEGVRAAVEAGEDTIRVKTDDLISAVHGMLQHYLSGYKNLLLVKNIAKTADVKPYFELCYAYYKLTTCVERMWYFIKTYLKLIDRQATVTSDLRRIPAKQMQDAEEPSNMTQADDLSGVASEAAIDVNELKEDLEPTDTNSWGTCAEKALDQIVAQGHAAKWIWRNKKTHSFSTDVLNSGKPGENVALWDQQSELKDVLEKDEIFNNISTIVKNREQHFSGSVHAELIVAAELLSPEYPAYIGSSAGIQGYIGISRPPCYVCYQTLAHISTQYKLSCRPAVSSNKVWQVDLPPRLPLTILLDTLKGLSVGAAQTFHTHKTNIQFWATESKKHTGRLRAHSVSSTKSDEMVGYERMRDAQSREHENTEESLITTEG